MMVALSLISPHSTYSFTQLHTKSQPAQLNETITCKPVGSFSRRLVTHAIPSGLRIRSAATKPAKSPGTDHLSALTSNYQLDDCVLCTSNKSW